MPTNAASNATAPRIRSTSARSVASASGSSGVSLLVIEIGLQNKLRGDLVAMFAALASAALAFQVILCDFGCPALVDQRNGQAETCTKLAREVSRLRRHRVRCAIGMQRQADHQLLWLPFAHQRGECSERRRIGIAGDRNQRLREADQ